MQFYVFSGRFSALVQIHNKNNMFNGKITKLQVPYKIRNQFDIGLNATYPMLSGSDVTVSQLIYE